MPSARHAAVPWSFGLRFKGQRYFLTETRTHRGTSGTPVVLRGAEPDPGLCTAWCASEQTVRVPVRSLP